MNSEVAKTKSIEDLFKELSTNKDGLSSAEAKKRLEEYGPNEIIEKKVNPLMKLLSYFWGPIPWMIEIAAILSIIIGHMEDFWIISALLLLNAGVGFWQEFKADNAIQALKNKLALEAKVKRNGKWIEINAKEIVPGDIIRVRSGDIIPADIKFIEGDFAQIDESALTGESLPVEKHTDDIGYDGSIMKQGEMTSLVYATGVNTYFGKTAKLVEGAKTVSHFQKAVVKIADYLIVLAVILVFIIFLVALFRHESLLDILQFALVLTVASIPVALPAVLSVTMAIGAVALARKEAIVSKLVAIEEMAGMDVLCSDKTGTITQNKITVAESVPMQPFSEKDVFLYGGLSSKEENNDPIDNAIFKKIKDLNEISKQIQVSKIEQFKPFDPVSKRTEAAVSTSGKKFKVSKGAPQIILSLLGNPKDIGDKVKKDVDEFARKGYRALGVSKTDEKQKWQFVGLIALQDPPREDSAETIKTANDMGVDIKMVTGDHLAIARQIAQQVNLGKNFVEASQLVDQSDREATKIVEQSDGFAQVFPEHKYHIVELLQKNDHIVGMTGDGVNDAPALKKADVGIAVAGATDAAKSAASIVLTKPGLSVIIDAIQQSRRIFQRMNNYAIYRITETIRVLLFVSLSIIVFKFYPVTALMIVLLALLNDAPIMTIAYDNVEFSEKPDKWNMRMVMWIATLLGVIGVLESFAVLYIGKDIFHLSNAVLQSFIYLKLSVSGHFTVFLARTKRHFWSIKPAKSLLGAVIITQLIATLITVYGFLLPKMGWGLAGFIWLEAAIVFVVSDFIKVGFYKMLDHENVKFKRK